MVFSGILFLMYFLPIFLLIYWLLPQQLKNWWITISSLLFYAWGAPVFIFFVLALAVIDYTFSKRIAEKSDKKALIVAIILNVGLLAYFKYTNFFMDNLNELFMSLNFPVLEWVEVTLPIGISFLTFQKISYLVDVYRGDCKPQKKIGDYLLFIFLFPQLIAGPIVRYKDIYAQIEKRVYLSYDNFYNGFTRFIFGLSKKVLFANVFGAFVDEQFKLGFENLSGSEAWLVLISYSFQLYFDFSGYSDMAIGLGKIMGFTIPENFSFPYNSKSITEFWKRWHITLGSWMKDYLYIPLGGNKNGYAQTYRNLFLVFTISGLWHGASWGFLLWGMYHGFFLVLERVFLGKLLKNVFGINMIYSLLIVCLGWVLFRTDSLKEALRFYEVLFDGDWQKVNISARMITMFTLAVGGLLFGVRFEASVNDFLKTTSKRIFWIKTISTLLLFTWCLGEVYSSNFNPFIYFKF